MFTTRTVPLSSSDDWRLLAQALDAERVVTPHQVHGREVAVIRRGLPPPVERPTCDALVADGPETAVAIRAADCVPVLLADARTGVVAAVHAGWRGTLATAVLVAVNRLKNEYGAKPENMRVAIGASAGPCCYEVGSEVIDAFTSRFGSGANLFRTTRPGHAMVDLLKANRDQLESAGVLPERIHTAPICTMDRTDLFFSYRKEKNLHGKVGRLMAVVGLGV